MVARGGRLRTESIAPGQGADTGIFSRGRPVHSRLLRTYNFNDLAGDIHENCMTAALDHALLNNAKLLQVFPALEVLF